MFGPECCCLHVLGPQSRSFPTRSRGSLEDVCCCVPYGVSRGVVIEQNATVGWLERRVRKERKHGVLYFAHMSRSLCNPRRGQPCRIRDQIVTALTKRNPWTILESTLSQIEPVPCMEFVTSVLSSEHGRRLLVPLVPLYAVSCSQIKSCTVVFLS